MEYLATPTLMRAARGTYARSVRAQLQAAGIDDLPRNAAMILAAIEDGARPLPAGLGVSKQAVSQLVDILVQRGYVERRPDADDRRRNSLDLTDEGHRALEVVAQGVEAVDRQLADRVSPDKVTAMREALQALGEIKEADAASGAGVPRPPRQLQQFSPIFPVADLQAALAHYASLGFTTFSYQEGTDYGFANRDDRGLHLSRSDHPEGAAAYLYVSDADALYQEWSQPGIGGQTHPVGPTAYGLREGAHVDPDGNLIRFGSPAPTG